MMMMMMMMMMVMMMTIMMMVMVDFWHEHACLHEDAADDEARDIVMGRSGVLALGLRI